MTFSTGGQTWASMLVMERGDVGGDTGDTDASRGESRLVSDAEATAWRAGSPDMSSDLGPTPVASSEVNDLSPPQGGGEATDVLPRQEGADARGDSGGDEGTADTQLERVLRGLDDVERLLDELITNLRDEEAHHSLPEQPVIEQRKAAAGIQQELRELRVAVTELERNGPSQDPSAAASVAAQQAAVASDIKGTHKRFPRKIAWSKIWQAFKRVVPHLWALITQLTRVKEWSVTGQIGGGVLGLASAGITITFG